MLNNNDTLLNQLRQLNLGSDEALLYLELLKGPATHLKLARATGVNRSKVYRLAEQLEKRSLVSVRSDDRGTFLIASDPATLEVELVTEEENIKSRRSTFEKLLPLLMGIKTKDMSNFIVHTYEGEEGFKQMMWHELKTKGENLMFGRGSLADFVSSPRWIAQHQQRMVRADYRIRELINPGEHKGIFTIDSHYQYRVLPKDMLPLESQIAVYNDTIAIYHWRHQQKAGLEIVNQALAETFRSMFEHFWDMAEAPIAAFPKI